MMWVDLGRACAVRRRGTGRGRLGPTRWAQGVESPGSHVHLRSV